MDGILPPLILSGEALSQGFARGNVFVYRDGVLRGDDFYRIDRGSVPVELNRLRLLMERVLEDLDRDAHRIRDHMDEDMASIFHAQMAVLQGLRQECETTVKNDLVSAGLAVRTVFRRYASVFRSMEGEIFRSKSDDVADLMHRLLKTLAGVKRHELERILPGSVLVAKQLLPSDTVHLMDCEVVGVIVEQGSAASHAALLTREAGIPMVGQVKGASKAASEGDLALVNGFEGKVFLRPVRESIEEFEELTADFEMRRSRAHARCGEPAVTGDGMNVPVMANIGQRIDAEAAMDNGADAIGLFRIEMIYLRRQQLPTEEELIGEMRQILEPVPPEMQTVIRLLDIGGDKRPEYLGLPKETNPALGLRGVRLLLKYPEILSVQLGALLELCRERNLAVLVPLVTLVSEMETIRKRLESESRRRGIAEPPPLGAMIETPGAVMTTREMASKSEFLSVGTNDLTQYTLATDRESWQVSHYFDDAHPSIYRLLEIIVAGANGRPVSVCGDLASRPSQVGRLLDCGVDSLSVAPPQVPFAKEAVRRHGSGEGDGERESEKGNSVETGKRGD